MGFCRRCGEIVPAQSVRCKCGGSSVAPVVQWNHAVQKGGSSPDRWAETYVSNNAEGEREHTRSVIPPTMTSRELSPSKPAPKQESAVDSNTSPTRPARRFPRPLSTTAPTTSFDSRVSHHIASTTARFSVSPTKRNNITLESSPGSTPADVITSPDNATLAKAYGSVLQRPETLPIHTCASCSTIFPPDATIYPDPQTPSGAVPRFFCRPCFAAHGGSKGNCASCGRDVLTATREGGFVESAGKVWHKRCFRCEGCYKEIGYAPMVDLLGRPSCTECFDTCLDRRCSPRTRKQSEPSNNLGGMRGRSRESSPALDELSERLGIKRPPASDVSRDSSVSPTPGRMRSSTPDDEFFRTQFSGSVNFGNRTSPRMLPRRHLEPIKSVSSSPIALMEPTTPDLSSASSDSISSRAPSTPSNSPRQSFSPKSHESITPRAKGTPTRLSIVTTGDSKCSRCSQSLFNTAGGGKIVTVPSEDPTEEPASYHVSCFRCVICGDTFNGEAQGQAMFVKSSRGACHPGCIATETQISKSPVDRPAFIKPSSHSPERPPASAPPLIRSFPRFGGSETCPGCHKAVSLMEYGVVPGPQSSRWHGNCLVCGGKGAKPPRPGCGKRLDSAAKTDRDGAVWCRECMLLLPAGACSSPQGSPTRGGLTPSYTGTGFDRFDRFPPPPEAGRLFGQVTGNTFVKSDALMVQLTGGGPSPMRRGSVSPTRQMTRSVSPTKGLMPITRHPRPMGTWRHRSIDEGRGMFLVKQMTGNGL